MKLTKEAQEPIMGPDMVRHDAFIAKNEVDGFKHHKHEFKKHKENHHHHMDMVEAMCGGGMSKGKK